MPVAYRSTCRSTIGQPLSVDISTNISASVGRHIDRYIGRYVDRHISVDISTDTRPICRPTYRSTLGRYVDRYIGRHSVDMSTDVSVEGCTKYTWSECVSLVNLVDSLDPVYMIRCLSYLNSMSDIVYKKTKFQFIQYKIVSLRTQHWNFIRFLYPWGIK